MTTEHEKPASADDEREEGNIGWQEIALMVQEALTAAGQKGHATPPMNFNDAIRKLAQERDAARVALTQAQADLALFEQQIVDQAEALGQEKARGDNLAKELSERNAHMDELHDALTKRDAEIDLLKPAPGYLSGKLNPFPERPPGTQAVEIARKHREEFDRACQGREWANQPDDDEWWGRAIEAAEARGRASQSPPPGASALAIAERFRLFFQHPYPTSEEGVNLAVMSLAQEIENVMRHNEAPPGADKVVQAMRQLDAWSCPTHHSFVLELDGSRRCNFAGCSWVLPPITAALEATRDLFQSLEGWRPTDDWTGVPPRLRLLFDRTRHAIEAAEARGRARL
jgi:hypothetical protein